MKALKGFLEELEVTYSLPVQPVIWPSGIDDGFGGMRREFQRPSLRRVDCRFLTVFLSLQPFLLEPSSSETLDQEDLTLVQDISTPLARESFSSFLFLFLV